MQSQCSIVPVQMFACGSACIQSGFRMRRPCVRSVACCVAGLDSRACNLASTPPRLPHPHPRVTRSRPALLMCPEMPVPEMDRMQMQMQMQMQRLAASLCPRSPPASRRPFPGLPLGGCLFGLPLICPRTLGSLCFFPALHPTSLFSSCRHSILPNTPPVHPETTAPPAPEPESITLVPP